MSDEASFLGAGWAWPPAFGPAGSTVAMVAGSDDIAQSLAILLTTRRGERVMQDDFGCELSEFMFGEISQGLIGRVRDVVADAILHHEPRINLNGVEISDSGAQAGLLLIAIDYTVRATNSRYNMVYPYYLNEASAAAG
ncbi:Baseplate wedge subunit [Rubrivivax sp. A210]|uniref:GPW/gp25 family protein n=1 Tax=Rubrivivax sp. A210 TaxID=2772301 RepID=UPI00191AF01A|nr:GPW/gp25 family protein [Rubrivivax sp. A210]CAD5372269.1 Baseplate wedge subunit [Rubrivivax sp. A210]